MWPDVHFPRIRPGDPLHHPWKFLRRDVPHIWYVDDRYPLMGFMSRDEATLLHNIALQFRGKRALEIGSWLGWSTCHIALAGVPVDVIDPAHADHEFRSIVEESIAGCGVSRLVNLTAGRSPDDVAALAETFGGSWSLLVIDGDHEGSAPLRDTRACLPFAAPDCAFVFHDLASPHIAAALRFLEKEGFNVLVYQTAQIMGIAWRGNVSPVAHVPDPSVAWQLPMHLAGLPVSGFDAGVDPASLPDDFSQPVTRRSLAVDRAFPRFAASDGGPKATVCIVTNEIIGPFKNGGIGTSMTGLAETLAAAGHRVTVLNTGGIWNASSDLQHWTNHYAALGIELVTLKLEEMGRVAGPLRECGFGAPALVYQYLRARHFDVVHFNDCCGEGYLALVARRSGLAFQQTLFMVALHSPSQWVLELNHTLPSTLLFAAFNFAERLSVRCAGVLWSPSHYMLRWAREHQFVVPHSTFVQKYALPGQPPLTPPVAAGRGARPDTIVFFGRLEERKGLRLFCNAIDTLREELTARQTTIVFLGKPGGSDPTESLDYIAARATGWRFPMEMLTTFGQPEALAYLGSGARLAVMPSPLDNSPCTVYEALAWGVPFVAADTGGIGELIHPEDRENVLFEYTTPALRAALLTALDEGGWIARAATAQAVIREQWVAIHENWRALLPRELEPEPPRETVAIIDHIAGMDIGLSLRSLESCPGVSRVIVLNRTAQRLPVRESSMPLREIMLLTEDAGSLTEELQRLKEEDVLLLHSGVAVLPRPFDLLRNALASAGVDGYVPAATMTGGSIPRMMPPLGGSASFSFFEGLTFTGGMLIRGKALRAAIGRRAFLVETSFLGLADFCASRGEDIWPWPEAVFERTEDFDAWQAPTLPGRVAAYEESSSIERYYMLSAAYPAGKKRMTSGDRKRLALAVADLGFSALIRCAVWGLRRARRLQTVLTSFRSRKRND